jgi:hypothetical protein
MLVAEALRQHDLTLRSAQAEAGGGLATPDRPALAHPAGGYAAAEALGERGGRRAHVLALEALLDLPQVLMAQRLKARLQLLHGEDDDPAACLSAAGQRDALPPLGFVRSDPPKDMSRRAKDESSKV